MSASDYFGIVLAALSGAAFVFLLSRVFFTAPVDHARDWFGQQDLVTAFGLVGLLGYAAMLGFAEPPTQFNLEIVKSGLAIDGIFAGVILGYLLLRKVPPVAFFGFRKMSWWKMVGLAALLIGVLIPLLAGVENALNPHDENEQQVVIFFRQHTEPSVRWLIAVSAVVVAPFCEELLFRGFLYGILQQYFGKVSSMFFTSVLFAAIHGHLPSLLPLILLAAGLTMGLELSGSLVVPMLMHAMFNATTLLFLVFDSTP